MHPQVWTSKICACVNWYFFISHIDISSLRGKRLWCHHTLAISFCCFGYPSWHQNRQWTCIYITKNETIPTVLGCVTKHWCFAHLATRQAIIECAHGPLKCLLDKQKEGMCGESPQSRAAKAIYTLDHLTVPEPSQNTVILNHFPSLQASGDAQSPKSKVMIRDYVTNKWESPWDLITWWHGYVVFLWTPEHKRYLPGVPAVLYILLGTRDNTVWMMPQRTSKSSDLNCIEIWDFLRWQVYLKILSI